MAQVIVRNLREDIRDRLRALAKQHGRSMEEEIREILREATLRTNGAARSPLGSRLAARFRGCKLKAGEIVELRGQPASPAEFER